MINIKFQKLRFLLSEQINDQFKFRFSHIKNIRINKNETEILKYSKNSQLSFIDHKVLFFTKLSVLVIKIVNEYEIKNELLTNSILTFFQRSGQNSTKSMFDFHFPVK